MNQKRNKGITLIALVITIIVLLILAGVTINMVLGDDGIISQANAAKDAYENESVKEAEGLFEMAMVINTNNNDNNNGNNNELQEKTKLQVKYGMLTGITPGTKVSEIKGSLPKGYDIVKEDGSAVDNKNTPDVNEETTTDVCTGMQVVKDDIMVSRLVIYGDVDKDGEVGSSDVSAITFILNDIGNVEYYQKEAADVKHDKIIDGKDYSIIESIAIKYEYKDVIDKNMIPNNSDEIVIKTREMAKKEYVEKANKYLEDAGNTTFKFEPVINSTTGEIKSYKLEGITSETTLQTLLSALPDNTVIVIEGEDEDQFIAKTSDATTLSGKVLPDDEVTVKLTVNDYYNGARKDYYIVKIQ